jgi:carbon monoxide dehydrogenase subunit G
MEMLGEYQISANRLTVWDALNEPEVLKACLQDCEHFEKISETDFEAIITTKVGPIKTTFSCSIELSDIDPPIAYTLSGQGNGGASGYAKGSIRVLLAENDGNTVLSYTVDASLRGKIGQMGSRVIDSVAKRMADDFFDKLTTIVHERAGVVAEDVPRKRKPGAFLLLAMLVAAVVALVILGIYLLSTNQQ